jgi:molybdopterin converting factor small subunit
MLSLGYARQSLPRRSPEGAKAGAARKVMFVEFLGIPRQRAGLSELEVEASTLGQLLDTLAVQCPALSELITVDGLHPSIVANLNGDEFVNDLATPLADDDRLLILSADAGG